MPNTVELLCGVDIGQRVDPTAICLAEAMPEAGERWSFTVRHLERLPLNTPYPQVARYLATLCRRTAAYLRESVFVPTSSGWTTQHRHSGAINLTLRLDVTGVGRPVYDTFVQVLEDDRPSWAGLRVGVDVVGCTFTFGDRLSWSHGGRSVGKAFLVSRLQTLLQYDRVTFPTAPASMAREAEALRDELMRYEIRITENANDTYGAFQTGAHDDLVTAAGLALLEAPSRAETAVYDRYGKKVY